MNRKNEIWFQSEQYLTNITGAVEFKVKKRWFRKEWNLYAVIELKGTDEWEEEYTYINTKIIGRYRSEVEATLGLTQVRKLLGIQAVSSLSFLDELSPQ